MAIQWTGLFANTGYSSANNKTQDDAVTGMQDTLYVTGPGYGAYEAVVKLYNSTGAVVATVNVSGGGGAFSAPPPVRFVDSGTVYSYSLEVVRGFIPTEDADGIVIRLVGGASKRYPSPLTSTPSGGVAVAGAVISANLRNKTARVVSKRLLGVSTIAPSTYTAHLCWQAPAHFSAVQIVLRGPNASAANAMTASVAPSAKFGNGWAAVDAADAPVTRTPVTWGSTDVSDFWNPGGGASSVFANEASGTAAANDLRENATVSDWIPLNSLNRTDDPTKPPILHVRIRGNQLPAADVPELAAANANPLPGVVPDLLCGVWGADYVITEAPAAPSLQNWAPVIEVRFLLRDKSIMALGAFGDSLEQGWIGGTSVPLFGGRQNGWPRKLANLLSTDDAPVSYFSGTWVGRKSQIFHNFATRVLQIQNPGITHLLVKPWSVNEAADGIASVDAGIARTGQIIAKCDAVGIVPIVVQPWAGQATSSAEGVAVAAYCDSLRADGRYVLDARAVVGSPGDIHTIRSEYLTRTSGGTAVDTTHINEAGHDAVAAFAAEQFHSWGFR